jgi:hypothetical protein
MITMSIALGFNQFDDQVLYGQDSDHRDLSSRTVSLKASKESDDTLQEEITHLTREPVRLLTQTRLLG